MFCKYCGKELPEKSSFCSNCGKRLLEKVVTIKKVANTLPQKKKTIYIAPESSKSRLLAALLAFFFGNLGAHRFYVGKFLSGFLQLILGLYFFISLIFCLVGAFEMAILMIFAGIIWGFWILVDFLMIICGAFTDGQGFKITDWDI